jgi:hypothetical protein
MRCAAAASITPWIFPTSTARRASCIARLPGIDTTLVLADRALMEAVAPQGIEQGAGDRRDAGLGRGPGRVDVKVTLLEEARAAVYETLMLRVQDP